MAPSVPLQQEASLAARHLTFLCILLASAAAADTVTYGGEDAERLKCAAMLSLASNHAEAEGRLQPGQHAKSMAAVSQLLDALPGGNGDKARAMQAMADRIMIRSTPDALKAEFQRSLPACGRFF